jgi:protocatechuate 4,5-dioxygenase alpha subunit
MGFHLNQFCMSLMKADNRAAFKADERAYLDRWPMSEAQKQAVLSRDWNGMIALGGNIYFTAKIAATDGLSFRQIAADDERRQRGGVRPDDAGRRPLDRRQPLQEGPALVARITAGVATSHVPAIGAALDNGKAGDDYWKPCSPATRPPRPGSRPRSRT